MGEKKAASENIAPELRHFYHCSQEEFETYWIYYMEFSPDYLIE